MAESKGETKDGQNDQNSTDTTTDSEHSDSGSSGNSGSGGTGTKDDHDSLREMVREEIKEALKGVKPDDNGVPRRQDIEGMAERMVREAAEKLEARKQHDADHEKIRNGNQPEGDKPPVSEEVPKKVRKLTKLFWGDAD